MHEGVRQKSVGGSGRVERWLKVVREDKREGGDGGAKAESEIRS